MSVVFFKSSVDLSTLDKLVLRLHQTLTSVPTTPWVLESSWFPNLSAHTVGGQGDPSAPPTVSYTNASETYATLIYKIGNDMSAVSPWRVKITFATASSTTMAGIYLDCGSATTGANTSGAAVSNPLPTPGGSFGFAAGSASNDASEWFVTADENGFLILVGNPTGAANGCFLIGCERSRTQAGVAQNDIILFTGNGGSNGPTGQYSTVVVAYTGSAIYCIARSYSGFETSQADIPLILRPINNSSSGRTVPVTAFEAPGDGSSLTASNILSCGPWLNSGGVRGQARLFMIALRGDIPSPAAQINVLQDNVSRTFYVPSTTTIANVSASMIVSSPSGQYAILIAKT